jgi:hypothetical protein
VFCVSNFANVFCFIQCFVCPMLPVSWFHPVTLETLDTQNTGWNKDTGNIGHKKHRMKQRHWQHWTHKTAVFCVSNVASVLVSSCVLCAQCCQCLCFILCFVCPMLPVSLFHPVFCVPNVASVSGLFILDCPFGILYYVMLRWKCTMFQSNKLLHIIFITYLIDIVIVKTNWRTALHMIKVCVNKG